MRECTFYVYWPDFNALLRILDSPFEVPLCKDYSLADEVLLRASCWLFRAHTYRSVSLLSSRGVTVSHLHVKVQRSMRMTTEKQQRATCSSPLSPSFLHPTSFHGPKPKTVSGEGLFHTSQNSITWFPNPQNVTTIEVPCLFNPSEHCANLSFRQTKVFSTFSGINVEILNPHS